MVPGRTSAPERLGALVYRGNRARRKGPSSDDSGEVGEYLQNPDQQIVRVIGLPDGMNGKRRSFRLSAIGSLRKSPLFTMLSHNRNYHFNESARIRIAHSKVATNMSGAFSHAAEPDSGPIRSQFGSLVRQFLTIVTHHGNNAVFLLTQHNPTAGGPRMPENIA